MRRIGAHGIRARAGGNRLNALAVGVAEDPLRIERERFSPPLPAQDVADPVEVL